MYDDFNVARRPLLQGRRGDAVQISTCMRISTTRFDGSWEWLVAPSALRADRPLDT
jgi:hypothetical protein